MEDTVKKRGYHAVIAYIIIHVFGASIIAVIGKMICDSLNINLEIKSNYIPFNSYINLICYLILFAALIYILIKDIKKDFTTLKSEKNNLAFKIFAGLGIFYVINMVISGLTSNIDYYSNIVNNLLGQHKEISTTSDNQLIIEQILNSNSAWAMFLAAGLLGPICEELVFRKAIFNLCKTKEMGLLVSSLLFGFIHITSSIGFYSGYEILLMLIPYIFSGVALGIVYIKNDCNIFIPTIVHILSNVISMAMIMIGF